MLLCDLPLEVLYAICYLLSGADIINLSKCNRALLMLLQDEPLWAQLTRDRFPSTYVTTRCKQGNRTLGKMATTRWQDVYMSKDSLRMSAANQMVIVNARMPFWRVVETHESHYGAIAKLYSICMLDIRGTVEGVPRGRYRIQWRMRFTLSAQWNEPLDFAAYLGNEASPTKPIPALSYTTPSDFYTRQDVLTNSWILITLPHELPVNRRFDSVTLSHGKKTNFWKCGIEIDWVRLVPSDTQDTGLVLQHEHNSCHRDNSACSLPSTMAAYPSTAARFYRLLKQCVWKVISTSCF